jgi:molybdate transport system substrate-binding protein
MRFHRLLLAATGFAVLIHGAHAAGLHVLAAGSLREVIGEIGARYTRATGVAVAADFGPSGVLRGRIENGQRADLFASADMGHPLKLLADGRAVRVVMFTRNNLCAFAKPALGLTSTNFVDRLLDPAVKLGTSTPKADPAGDYTWLMFHKIDLTHQGAFTTLDHKARQIVGGPANNAPIDGKDPAAAALIAGRIDVMIGYCSGARRMQSQLRDVAVLVPKQIAAGPEYGLAILKGADPHAEDLALYMLSPEGQQIFAQFGFAPVALPAAKP